MRDHDHGKCVKAQVVSDEGDYWEEATVYSLPAGECDWGGHQAAIDEHGYCPVCQH